MTLIVVTNRQYEKFKRIKDKKAYSKIMKSTNLLKYPESHLNYLSKSGNNQLVGAETNLTPF